MATSQSNEAVGTLKATSGVKSTYTITGETVVREVNGQSGATKDLDTFLTDLAKQASFQTGLLPPILRSYSRSAYNEQFVLTLPPGVYLTPVEYDSGDNEAYGTLELAMPWRVVIAESNNDNLVGGRLFYSPVPIMSLDQPLYAPNLPNINLFGYYSHTLAVGWVCWTPRESWRGWSIADRVRRIAERISGEERFNTNMTETDGIYFYRNYRPESPFLYQFEDWEQKSQAEGWEWTLDPELWVPIQVSERNQLQHDPKGHILTLGEAIDGPVSLAYGQAHEVRPAALARQGKSPAISIHKAYVGRS